MSSRIIIVSVSGLANKVSGLAINDLLELYSIGYQHKIDNFGNIPTSTLSVIISLLIIFLLSKYLYPDYFNISISKQHSSCNTAIVVSYCARKMNSSILIFWNAIVASKPWFTLPVQLTYDTRFMVSMNW